MYGRLDSLNERSSVEPPRNTLKPTWQDFVGLNVDICGFTGVKIVVLNTKFDMVSFLH
jgi:hypothetical protein